MDLIQRFLRYVSFDTQSDTETDLTPSTPGQIIFARALEDELKTIGLDEVQLDSNGYLTATLPANCLKNVPVIGFIAHMDTSPDMSGKKVQPGIVNAYDGLDILLDEKEVSPCNLPSSPNCFTMLGRILL